MSEIERQGVTRRWSEIVVHQGTAYFVEVASDPSVPARQQFEQLLAQVDERLAQVGSDRTRLLQVVVYLPYPEDVPTFNELWDQWVPTGHAPSRACIHAPLIAPQYRGELIITAAAGK